MILASLPQLPTRTKTDFFCYLVSYWCEPVCQLETGSFIRNKSEVVDSSEEENLSGAVCSPSFIRKNDSMSASCLRPRTRVSVLHRVPQEGHTRTPPSSVNRSARHPLELLSGLYLRRLWHKLWIISIRHHLWTDQPHFQVRLLFLQPFRYSGCWMMHVIIKTKHQSTLMFCKSTADLKFFFHLGQPLQAAECYVF